MFPTRYENTDPTLIWLKRFWTLYHVNHELSEGDAQTLAQYFNPNFDSQRAKFFLTVSHCVFLFVGALFSAVCYTFISNSGSSGHTGLC